MNLLLYLTHSIVCVCVIKQQSENNHGGPTWLPHAHSFEIYLFLQWTHTMWNILAVNNFYIERKNEILKLILKEFVLAQHQQNHHHQQHKSKINKQQKHLRGIFSSSFWCVGRDESAFSPLGYENEKEICLQSKNLKQYVFTHIHINPFFFFCSYVLLTDDCHSLSCNRFVFVYK